MSNHEAKERIKSHFGAAANQYEREAHIQKQASEQLIDSLRPWRGIIPAGPVIELGCGTGFVTEGLVDLYPDREIEVTDLSSEMVEFCRHKFSDAPNLTFKVRDADDTPAFEEPHYGLVISGFTAQWFRDPAYTLNRWLEAIKPGGLLLISFLGNESFPEWKKYAKGAGVPFTANSLPDVEEMAVKMSLGPAQIDYYEDTVSQRYESASEFFRHLKIIGASVQQNGKKLSSAELSKLIDHWDTSTFGDITVSYHIVFLVVKRDYNS